MADRTPTVMIVDDEEIVTTSVRAFLMLETDFRVECFTDPERAVNCLKNGPVDLVVSDYLMPKMNGIQLLKASKSRGTTRRCCSSSGTGWSGRNCCGSCAIRRPT